MGNYSKEEIDFVSSNFKTMPYKRMARELGIGLTKVKNICKTLGLKRSPEEINYFRNLTCFKKGHIPPNKGIKGIRISPATEFKKGHLPHNTKHNGCIVIRGKKSTGEKYKYIRVAQSNWKLLHRVLWEKHYGPIPDRSVIRFKNGDSLDVRLENLMLVEKLDNAKLNHNYEKSRETHKRLWREGKMLTDNRVAGFIARNNRELKEELMHYPELLELKRKQLKLKTEMEDARRK